MRISISGSHSTGKSSLTEACYNLLLSRFPNDVNIIKEVARQVIGKGFPLNKDATCESYYNYILAQLKAEREANRKHVISDRSLVDLLAYIITNKDPRIPHYFTEMIEEIVWLEVKYFDIYCYLPVTFPLVVDGVRPEDENYRAAVDKTLAAILKEYRVHFEEITGTPEERCQKVLAFF